MTPEEKAVRSHIAEANFQIGVDEGRWGIEKEYPWPFVLIWVKAASKTGCPDKYCFRFDLTGYPSAAPTACPWDAESDKRLDNQLWPKGGNHVASVFNPGWNGGIALYAPCDRIAIPGHGQWATKFPHLWWRSDFKIIVYLNFLYQLLNSPEYASS